MKMRVVIDEASGAVQVAATEGPDAAAYVAVEEMAAAIGASVPGLAAESAIEQHRHDKVEEVAVSDNA